MAAFRDGLDVQARTELDAITGAPHLQSKPVAGAMEGRLAKALGTPVEVDPTIPHGEVRVVPEVGPLGIVTGVKIVVGRGASVAAVIAHIPSLYQKQRLVGLAGSARRIVAAVKRLLAGGGTLPVTSRGHEAWEEVQKLPPIIDAKLKQLAGDFPAEFEGLVADRRGDIATLQGRKAEAKAEYLKAWRALDDRAEYRRLVEVKLTALGVDPKTGTTPPVAASPVTSPVASSAAPASTTATAASAGVKP